MLCLPNASGVFKIIELTREMTGYTDPGKEVYDALLDQYEEDMDSATIDALFEDLKRELIPLVKAILGIIVNGNPEILISAQNVFIKPGLALMKAHIAAASGSRVVIFRIDVLLENAVSAFVNGGENGT